MKEKKKLCMDFLNLLGINDFRTFTQDLFQSCKILYMNI